MTIHSVDTTLARVESLYKNNLREHGCTSKSVGWNDVASQNLRFRKLLEVVAPEKRQQGFSCNDWGCGYAAMLEYMRDVAGFPVHRYYGYDLSAEMLQAAEQKSLTNAEYFHSSDVNTAADYTFVSGTFNVRFDATDDDWLSYIKDSLQSLWKHSKKGLAFNLLSKHVDWTVPHLYYGDIAELQEYCMKNLSRYVKGFHDYALYEWTICVSREGEQP